MLTSTRFKTLSATAASGWCFHGDDMVLSLRSRRYRVGSCKVAKLVFASSGLEGAANVQSWREEMSGWGKGLEVRPDRAREGKKVRRLWQRSGFFGSWTEAARSETPGKSMANIVYWRCVSSSKQSSRRKYGFVFECWKFLRAVVNYLGAVLVVRVGRERVRNW